MSDYLIEYPLRAFTADQTCGECRRKINRGENYFLVVSKDDGELWTAILCAHCKVVAEYLTHRDGEVWYGGIAEVLEVSAETSREYRYMLEMRRKWTRKDGTLVPVPKQKHATLNV